MKIIKITKKAMGEDYRVVQITDAMTAMKESEGTNWDLQNKQYANFYLQHGPLYLIYKNGEKYAMAHPDTGMMTDIRDMEITGSEQQAINLKIKQMQGFKNSPNEKN
jgi:hypothetical protein